MKRLRPLLKDVKYIVVKGSDDVEIDSIQMDSRKVTEGDLFFCISGFKVDGHNFAKDVAQKGAKVLIIEKDIDLSEIDNIRPDMTVIKVADSRWAMAFISAAYYDHPADKLKIIGITGTKGKTTSTYLIKSILDNAGIKTGLIGSIEVIIGDKRIPAVNTTPESFLLQDFFHQMVEEGIQVVVMEVASQGLKLHRTQGFTFDLGVFTNLSRDHIGPNEHESMEEYIECKSRLFKQCKKGIVNADDPNLLKVIEGHTCNLETFGFNEGASFSASNLKLVHKVGELGIAFDVKGDVKMSVEVPTPGKFSVYNALTAIAVCSHLGVDKDVMKEALKHAKAKGRIEMVETPYPFTLLIDYAHNQFALESLLSTLREYEPNRLICLFGCGGDRSPERRFSMGEVSGKLADLTIITSDNPRSEDPLEIIKNIRTGIERTKGKFVEIVDRKDAIRYAINNGKPHDIIVLAGKGHEDYQEIKGVKYPMDERVIIKEILEENK